MGFSADYTHGRIRSHPNLNFVVVINPNSGPDGRPFLPDEQYQRAVPYLQDYPNVRLVGYIKTLYGKRDIENVKHDVDLYSHWHNLSKTKKTGPMGLDGIFVDEVDWAGEYSNYMEVLCQHIRSRIWRTDKSGTTLGVISDVWLRGPQSRLCYHSCTLLQHGGSGCGFRALLF